MTDEVYQNYAQYFRKLENGENIQDKNRKLSLPSFLR